MHRNPAPASQKNGALMPRRWPRSCGRTFRFAAIGVALIVNCPPTRRYRRRLFGWGDRERDPGVPPFRPIPGGELVISLEVEITLHVGDREQEADLRTNGSDTRLEIAENRRGADI